MRLVVVSDSGMEHTAIERIEDHSENNDNILQAMGVYKKVLEAMKSLLENEYNPNYGDGRDCVCGHQYYRHFDTYDDMRPVGCKYCHRDDCSGFRPSQAEQEKP